MNNSDVGRASPEVVHLLFVPGLSKVEQSEREPFGYGASGTLGARRSVAYVPEARLRAAEERLAEAEKGAEALRAELARHERLSGAFAGLTQGALPRDPRDELPPIGGTVKFPDIEEAEWTEVVVAGYAVTRDENAGSGRRRQRIRIRAYDPKGRLQTRDLDLIRR